MIKRNKTLCFVRSLSWRRSTTQLPDFMVVDEKTLVLDSNLEFSIRRWRSSPCSEGTRYAFCVNKPHC